MFAIQMKVKGGWVFWARSVYSTDPRMFASLSECSDEADRLARTTKRLFRVVEIYPVTEHIMVGDTLVVTE